MHNRESKVVFATFISQLLKAGIDKHQRASMIIFIFINTVTSVFLNVGY